MCFDHRPSQAEIKKKIKKFGVRMKNFAPRPRSFVSMIKHTIVTIEIDVTVICVLY